MSAAADEGSVRAYQPPNWLARTVNAFGRSARQQLSTGADEPEEALRAPLVALVKEIGSRHGLQGGAGRRAAGRAGR